MTQTYRIRGSKQAAEPTPLTTSEVAITRTRRLLPGLGRGDGAAEIDASADEVVRVELENGFVLWTRADDLVREWGLPASRAGGDGWVIGLRPPIRSTRAATRGERGWLGLGVKLLDFFGVDLKGKAAAALGDKLELKLLGGRTPGLYRLSLDDAFSLTAVPEGEVLPSADPILVFIHGTGSSCDGSYRKLWEGPVGAAARRALQARYGDRVYALEHRSLTVSPIQNALDLARHLPKNAQVHLVTHSRGGLVGELLCLAQRDRTDDPLKAEYIDTLFAADRTLAEQIGLAPLDDAALQQRDEAYQADRERLKKLLEILGKQQIKIGRFVRVACPARGTTLASGRLDRWLSVLDHLSGYGLLGDTADFMLAVVKERTDPRTLPGLEAMMPGSALTRLLQHPLLVTTADLTVISGDTEGNTLWGQIKLLATDWFYGADHDLVVNTGSMYGGLRRPEKGARFLRDQGPDVSHFNYFTHDKSVRWLVAGLTRSDNSDGGFMPITAAKQETPKWREAVRRSRSKGTPQPLAVVLPGTMGSALGVGDESVWLKYLALFRGGLGRLKMGAVGINPIDLLDDFYGPLLEFLARSHRVEIFPYDWRLSVREAAAKLADKLEVWLPEIEQQGLPVHIVAHSMGGLVVRAMIADGGRGAALWRRIISLPNSRFMMLGTPNLGSYEAVRWLTGHNPTQAKISLLDMHHNTDEIIGIVNCFPGLLELLPFDADSPDFTRQALWTDLKQQLAAHWNLADATGLTQARGTWDFLKQAVPDSQHMIYVAGSQDATVVDYQLTDYDEPELADRKRIEFIASRDGDGTVTWASGRLPGVPTWYVEDTAHDELCKNKRAFPGYLDLLTSGATTRLLSAPPTRKRAQADEPERFVLPTLPPTDDIPDEASLPTFGFGSGRPFDEETADAGVPIIQVSLRHGNLAYSRYPVLVGHYQDDIIISAEKALDDRLAHALSRRQQLGLYPGKFGTHALFLGATPRTKPAGALVIGLGQVGDLSPGLLSKGVRDAMLEYALCVAQMPVSRFGTASTVRSGALTCLLVGSGAGGMTVRDSVEAILRGAVAANAKLVQAELQGKVVIDNLEFIELYEDIALSAAEALNTVLRDGDLAKHAVWTEECIEEGQGRLKRVRCDEAPNWWHRLEIIEDARSETLRFIATTDRARAEETLASGQLRLVDGFIRQAAQSSSANAAVAQTLFEMLLPNRLKELAPKQADLVILVDAVSARYPWELLEDRWSNGKQPPSVAAGLIRQLKTPVFRPHPAHASTATAFVVGNPDLGGWDKFGDLPGARQEAQKVSTLLEGKGYRVLSSLGGKASEILSGLHSDGWRILHLAGHGEHEFALDAPNTLACVDGIPLPPKTVSGMVIGKNIFLTPGDVEQMRWVPELVFINCCHLGKTLSKTAALGQYNLLAANLAVQFINMGVKAVVAAGWAVDDGAAEAFAASFYGHLLAGESFGRAVRAAREEIWMRFPDANTWGAYQCYGDPSYQLRPDGGAGASRETKPYHAPSELIAALCNYTEWSRMQMREQDEAVDELATLREGIATTLKGVPDKVKVNWLARADVAAALGFAWGETGAWAEAVECLETALHAETGDCPVRALEQCASFRVRLAGERWETLRVKADKRGVEAERQALVAQIERAILELDTISGRAATPERLSLVGSAYKRLAWLQNDTAPRREALLNMANAYGQAHKLMVTKAKESNEPLMSYGFTNWAVAKLLSERYDPEPDKTWRDTLEEDCRQIVEAAQARNQQNPSYWDGVGEADCALLLLLTPQDLEAKAADARAAEIASLYRAAAQRGASFREYASVRENLDFIIALTGSAKSKNSVLTNALAALRAAL